MDLALEYRPRRFADVVGQDRITQTLRNAVTRGIGAGYLFFGPSGVGKTTMARIFDKALNCEKPDRSDPEPCGECETCRREKGLDEQNSALERGIEAVRRIARSMQWQAPLFPRYTVHILDEVHQYTQEAWNALLSLLEQPRERLTFVLVTTELDKIPQTIRTRVQRFKFEPVESIVITKRLVEILTAAKIEFDLPVVSRIAANAGGSPRQAIQDLQQAIAFGNGQVKGGDGAHTPANNLGAALREKLAAAQRPLTPPRKRPGV